LRKEHHPYIIKATINRITSWYVKRFIRPQFDDLGKSPSVLHPTTIQIFYENIKAGDFLHLISGKTHDLAWQKYGGAYCLK